MKKLLQILSSVVIGTACMGSFASAASCEGTLTLTGPQSNNTIGCNEVNNITLTCNNNVVAATVNAQDAISGTATDTINTYGGNVATGQALNNNGTNVTVGVTGCEGAALAGGGGGGGGAAAPEEAPSGVGALPDTASAPVAAIAAVSVAIFAGIAASSRLAVAAYRHFTAK